MKPQSRAGVYRNSLFDAFNNYLIITKYNREAYKLGIKRELMMKSIFSIFGLAVLLFGLVACGGGDSSSSSGGGEDLNLNGMWRVHHHFNEGGDFIRTYTLTLVQSGNSVTGTDIVPDPGPGPSPDSPCDSRINSYSGEVSGNSFSGAVASDIYTETFTVSGSSNYLEGGFTVIYPAGTCRGTYKGNMIMTRI